MKLLQMSDIDLHHKRVMIREDFNVPIHHGVITNDKRIVAALPTIIYALEKGAAVILVSHLGRPTAGVPDPDLSLAPIATYLSQRLGLNVKFMTNWLDGIDIKPGEVVLCENVRFNEGEANNDQRLAAKMAAVCDVFVMDAFATAHRAQASTYGVATKVPTAVAGPLLMAELKALATAYSNPASPQIAIVGGAKVSTKLTILKQLVTKVDYLILGGGIANTFLAAQGINVGHSLCELELLDEAKQVLDTAAQHGCIVPLPIDVVVATSLTADSIPVTKTATQVNNNEMIGDIGPQTINKYLNVIQEAKTIIWNGPLGIFELPAFAAGTKAIALAIAKSKAFSLAGGGDTIAAIDEYRVADHISYISTGGGAFLEFLEGRTLPGVAILEQRCGQQSEVIHG